jgi:hypothetical protein
MYLLSENDLLGIAFYEGKCAFGKGVATFYLKLDVINQACIKYNTNQHELNIVLQSIKNNKKIEKKQELIKALTNVIPTFRFDSVLCEQYINGESEYTVEKIAKRMAEMKYLFEYCHMKKCK